MGGKHEVTLNAGKLLLRVDASIGGSISAFEWLDGTGSTSILRRSPRPLQKVLDAACFPLVPYANRIRDGRFTFRGREVPLRPNMAGDASPLHGQGWLGSWEVQSRDDCSAVLTFSYPAGEWPWGYDARQDFRLDEEGFGVTLSCRNTSAEPMPCGLGQHPYFLCGPQTRLDTQVTSAWTIDDKVLPVDKVPAEGKYDLRDRLVCGQGLDNGFGGWGGEARISDPSWPYSLRLSSTDASFFQVYSPATGGFFAAEPVGHANAALNAPEEQWRDLGIRVLEPGEQMTFHMRLDVIVS